MLNVIYVLFGVFGDRQGMRINVPDEDDIHYAILFTKEHVADVIDNVAILKQQNVLASNLHLFQGQPGLSLLKREKVNILPTGVHGLTNIYKWMFSAVKSLRWVVILEDDLRPGSDFVAYMRWGRQIMRRDSRIFSVSAWNDNAVSEHKLNPSTMLRTNQFMGLGWLTRGSMLHQRLLQNCNGAWDSCVAHHVTKEKLVSIFPQMPRVLHVTGHWASHHVQKKSSVPKYPAPNLFLNYMDYVKTLCKTSLFHQVHPFEASQVAKHARVLYAISYMNRQVYGSYNQTVVYASRTKPHIISYYNLCG